MDDTQVGSEGKKESTPEDVAKQGIEALLAGKDHVYARIGEDQDRRNDRQCHTRVSQGCDARENGEAKGCRL